MIAVIDYGSGNLRSVAKALESVGGAVVVTSDPAVVGQARHLVLPGVGAFGDCRQNLESSGLLEPVLRHIDAGRPFLGICVGMQLLFTEGHEFGRHPGFNRIPGSVISFERHMADPTVAGRQLKIPHMGWNAVKQEFPHPLWADIPDESHFYFVHSFHGVPDRSTDWGGSCSYGIRFAAAVARDNLFGTQFHPEKSQKMGLSLLRNFIHWQP